MRHCSSVKHKSVTRALMPNLQNLPCERGAVVKWVTVSKIPSARVVLHPPVDPPRAFHDILRQRVALERNVSARATQILIQQQKRCALATSGDRFTVNQATYDFPFS